MATTLKASFRRPATRFNGRTISRKLLESTPSSSEEMFAVSASINSCISMSVVSIPFTNQANADEIARTQLTCVSKLFSWCRQLLFSRAPRKAKMYATPRFTSSLRTVTNLKPNLTLNYGLRWELNTPYYRYRQSSANFPSRPGHHAISLLSCLRIMLPRWASPLAIAGKTPRTAITPCFPWAWCFPAIKASRAD